MSTEVQNMTIQGNANKRIFVIVAPLPFLALSSLALLLAGQPLASVLNSALAISWAGYICMKSDFGRPLSQQELDKVLAKAVTAVRHELCLHHKDTIEQAPLLSIEMRYCVATKLPDFYASVYAPGQWRPLSVTKVVREAFWSEIPQHQLTATSRWLDNRRYTVRLDPPTSHELIEALAEHSNPDIVEDEGPIQ
jgi:hypothetical protein